jgi:hypothetical protein
MNMKIDGQCHCGAITYEAEVDPEKVIICHCSDCQSLSGTAFRTVVPTREQDFRLLSGQPKSYIKTAESGNKREQTFCPECGTPLYATSVGDGPRMFGLRLGAVRQRDQLVPKKQYWARSALPWLPELGSIPKVEKQ